MRSRGWCFTLNNYTDEEIVQFCFISAEYSIFGFEEGEKEETPHLQGFIYFKNAHTLESVRKMLNRAHWEPIKGTPQQAADYCKKEDDWYEFGILPRQGRLSFEEIESVMKDPTLNFHLYNQYRKAYNEFKNSQQEPRELRKLIAIPFEYRFKVARSHETGVFMDPEIETYNNEDVAIMSSYSSFSVENWINGFPPRFKRGYELIMMDPRIVYLTYSDPQELGHIKKLYEVYIDRVWLTLELERVERDSGLEALNLSQLDWDL